VVKKLNSYEFEEEIGKCFLKDGGMVLFDKEDYAEIKSLYWRLSTSSKNHPCTGGYVVSRVKGRQVAFHRIIMNCPSNMVIDHINHNKLDCRKSNRNYPF
jgi:hypothetical protein